MEFIGHWAEFLAPAVSEGSAIAVGFAAMAQPYAMCRMAGAGGGT